MYQEVVLPGFAVPPHPCPGCGETVPRGYGNLLVPRSVRERRIPIQIEKREIDPLEPGDSVDHLGNCPYRSVHPILLLACRSGAEMNALLADLNITPSQAAGTDTPG